MLSSRVATGPCGYGRSPRNRARATEKLSFFTYLIFIHSHFTIQIKLYRECTILSIAISFTVSVKLYMAVCGCEPLTGQWRLGDEQSSGLSASVTVSGKGHPERGVRGSVLRRARGRCPEGRLQEAEAGTSHLPGSRPQDAASSPTGPRGTARTRRTRSGAAGAAPCSTSAPP